MSRKTQPNEFRIIRVYDAPVRLVWEAWTDVEQVAKWWGPRGFTLTTHSKELRPGGHWHYTMHGPDGTDYINKTIYYEVEPERKLVYDHGGSDERKPIFRVTALFSESNGKTTLDMTMAMQSPEEVAAIRKFIREANGNSTWDRLAEYLGDQGAAKNRFVINWCFPAAVTDVFAAWTKPELLQQWLPPTGFNMEYSSAEIRPGGQLSCRMANAAGMTLHGRFSYEVVAAPEQLVYLHQFLDAQGNVSRHPMLPVWPATMKTQVQFVVEDEGDTRVTLTCEPHGDASSNEIEAFCAHRASMTQGWSGSFDRLTALLAGQR